MGGLGTEEGGCYGFWKYHFGTDMQIASWLFLVSSALFIGMEIDKVRAVRAA